MLSKKRGIKERRKRDEQKSKTTSFFGRILGGNSKVAASCMDLSRADALMDQVSLTESLTHSEHSAGFLDDGEPVAAVNLSEPGDFLDADKRRPCECKRSDTLPGKQEAQNSCERNHSQPVIAAAPDLYGSHKYLEPSSASYAAENQGLRQAAFAKQQSADSAKSGVFGSPSKDDSASSSSERKKSAIKRWDDVSRLKMDFASNQENSPSFSRSDLSQDNNGFTELVDSVVEATIRRMSSEDRWKKMMDEFSEQLDSRLQRIEDRITNLCVLIVLKSEKNVIRLSNSSTSPPSFAAQLPELKEKKGFMGGWKDDVNRTAVDEFCRHLMRLPSEILEQKDVTNFFTESSSDNEIGALNMLKKRDSMKRQSKEKGKADAPSSSSSSQVTPAPTIDSASSNPSNNSYSINPYEEIDGLPNSLMPNNLPLPSIYSVVKSDPADKHFVGADGYAECTAATVVGTASTSPMTKNTKTEVKRAMSDQPELYAFVNKPKLEPQASSNSQCEALYADTNCFPAQNPKPDLVLYEDATSISLMNPVPLKPSLSNDSWRDVKIPAAKPPTPAPAPLTSIPPMPPFPAPMLKPLDMSHGDSPKGDETVGEIQVVAIGDYETTADNVLSFRKGALASLLLQSDSSWWCVRLGSVHGWVPAAYWRMLNSGECANLITKGNSAWFVGKLSRAECETLLMEHGQQRHFVVRESNSGHYALSVKYNNKIHHFPIEVTADKKYNIGRHDFKTVNNIILYYQKNALFHDDRGQEVTLGSPLVIIKH